MADLTDADKAVIAVMLREAIAADARFPLSPHIQRLKVILDKLDPPLKPPGEPSMVVARMRGTKRQR
jgi:hypothetical protein